MPANRPNRVEIERKAIELHGDQSQIDKMIEEMSELTKALLKWRQYVGKLHRQDEIKRIEQVTCDCLKGHVREEIADVQIMLDQLKMIFGTTLIEEDAKLTRLAGRLGMDAADVKMLVNVGGKNG